MITDERKDHWQKLFKNPDWYVSVIPEVQASREKLANEMERETFKKELYNFFEEHIKKNNIAFEKNPPDTDRERKLVDTIVIHHTSNPPGMSKERLSAIELIRLYAPYFYEPKTEANKSMKGRPIYSGHARNGRQVFWPYHWFIRKDGSAERLLEDGEIGWHAGNWDVNCRSVAICFDNDYEDMRPSGTDGRSVASALLFAYITVSTQQS